MLCWTCDEAARGVCAFCGRAVCREHATTRPGIVTIYTGAKHTPKAVVVNNVLFCGECRPIPDPVSIPEIY